MNKHSFSLEITAFVHELLRKILARTIYICLISLLAIFLIYTKGNSILIGLLICFNIIIAIMILSLSKKLSHESLSEIISYKKRITSRICDKMVKIVIVLSLLAIMTIFMNKLITTAFFLKIILIACLYFLMMDGTRSYGKTMLFFRQSLFILISIIAAYLGGLVLFGISYNPVIKTSKNYEKEICIISVSEKKERISMTIDEYKNISWRHNNALSAYGSPIKIVSGIPLKDDWRWMIYNIILVLSCVGIMGFLGLFFPKDEGD